MKVIFLDIDGVLNSDDWYTYRHIACTSKEINDDYPLKEIDPKALMYLKTLVKETKAKIVISSSWKHSMNVEKFTELFKKLGFEEEIIDVTPDFGYHVYPRGCEILAWIKNFCKTTDIENYVILDDDIDMLYCQKDNFIPINSEHGLILENVQEAIKILNKNNMDNRNLTLSLKSANEIYKTASDEVKTILENTFPELVKNKYPMTHSELLDLLEGKEVPFINNCSEVDTTIVTQKHGPTYDYNCNISLSKQRAEEHLAFIQLIALCDKWNEIDEFKIDWTDSNSKYSIMSQDGKIFLGSYIMTSFPLTFKTKETRDLFYRTFEDLIEEAKNLI